MKTINYLSPTTFYNIHKSWRAGAVVRRPGTMLRKYLSLVVLLCSESVSASSSCCATQVVGDKKYNFNSEMDTSSHNCKDNCVYKEDGSNNMVCFAAGNLEAVCEDSTSSTSSGELCC